MAKFAMAALCIKYQREIAKSLIPSGPVTVGNAEARTEKLL